MRRYTQSPNTAQQPEYDEIMCWRCKRFFPFAELKIAIRNGRKLCVYCTDSEDPYASSPATL